MPNVFNRNKERTIVHTFRGADGKLTELRLPPNKTTALDEAQLKAIRKGLHASANADLIQGDEAISEARASSRAKINQARARAEAAEKENAALKAQLAALEKLVNPTAKPAKVA